MTTCPLRPPEPPPHDEIDSDGFCSFCGSLSGDLFIQRLEAGTVEILPTDKDYKVYVQNTTGENFTQHFVNNGAWTSSTTSQVPFKFQHLTYEQMVRFVELFNDGKLRVGFPGHFYVAPYFLRFVSKDLGS